MSEEIGRIDCGYCTTDSALTKSGKQGRLSVACPQCGTHFLQKPAGQALLARRMKKPTAQKSVTESVTDSAPAPVKQEVTPTSETPVKQQKKRSVMPFGSLTNLFRGAEG